MDVKRLDVNKGARISMLVIGLKYFSFLFDP